MIANYHTHTWRCMHAEGTEREYVERAIEGGLKILGFSDHTPMPYANGYVSNVKMRLNQLEGYVDTVLNLKKEYEKDIEIHLGLEVEYYPKYFKELLHITGQYPIEYFPLAQHFLGNEIDDVHSGRRDPGIRRFWSAIVWVMPRGHADGLVLPSFAHPDLLHFTGDPAVYDH